MTIHTYASIWQTLSKIDVSEHVEKKMNLSYLSWAWAWGVLMQHYPEASYVFPDPTVHPDGTVTVRCRICIGPCDREMWLPVMDHKNNAIPNPDARKISDSRMRCLVKCLAMFGLGHYIYAGEDLPDSDIKHTKADPLDRENLTITEEHRNYAYALTTAVGDKDDDHIREFWNDLKEEGEEFGRAVWSLMDSKTRSYIKKVLETK